MTRGAPGPQHECVIDCATTSCNNEVVCPVGWNCTIGCTTTNSCVDGPSLVMLNVTSPALAVLRSIVISKSLSVAAIVDPDASDDVADVPAALVLDEEELQAAATIADAATSEYTR